MRFGSKWCAALSSAVSQGGPEGQVAGFNAKVLFCNTSVQNVYGIERFVKNEHLQQVPQYLKLQIHAFNDPKRCIFVCKQLGFCSTCGQKWQIFEKV